MRGENQSTQAKTSHGRVENQQTQSTYDTESNLGHIGGRHIDFFMESADVRYLRTSLFSQNERARLCERVSFVKTNECVNIVQKHFP